jgi:UDP-N-acetylmuramoyl-L-alanyl-D-glutamate--2,6-diaminopimelate ligase
LLERLGSDPRYVNCDPQTTIGGLCVDSRKVRTGDAFVAVPGATHDPHRFVADVFAAGASVAIVQEGRIDEVDGPHVVLPDTAAAYPDIAAAAFGYPGEALRMAGVTGTNGKTTTAHLVQSIFAQAGLSHARLGTTGNWVVDREEPTEFTTPFPIDLQALLARTRDRGGTHLVMEVSSHALAQGRARPLRYDAVGFTSFSQDHLDFHPDMESYLQAKCLLAREHLKADGVAVAAVDGQPAANVFLDAARQRGARAWRASRGDDPQAELRATSVTFGADRTTADVHTPSGTMRLNSPLIAPYNLDNALVATGLALGLDIELAHVEAALASATGAPGRLERVAIEGVCGPAVVVDYAHTPDAVERAVAAVRGICQGRLHVVLGCGGDRDPDKRPKMGRAAAVGGDVFWATSDNPRTEDPEAIVDQMLAGVPETAVGRVVREVDRARAIARAIAEASTSDLVLIAGKGHEDYQVLGTEKIHFDDREHARAALKSRG